MFLTHVIFFANAMVLNTVITVMEKGNPTKEEAKEAVKGTITTIRLNSKHD